MTGVGDGVTSGPCITLASYNMHKAVGLDGKRDPHRVLRVLQEIDADIVALQEADRRVGGRGSTVPHELIDSHGLYKPVHLGVRHKRMFDKARRHTDRLLKVNSRNIGWHGNAILVKRHIGVLSCAALDLPTLEPRGAVIAELLVGELRCASSACTSICRGCGGGGRCGRSSTRSSGARRKCRRC